MDTQLSPIGLELEPQRLHNPRGSGSLTVVKGYMKYQVGLIVSCLVASVSLAADSSLCNGHSIDPDGDALRSPEPIEVSAWIDGKPIAEGRSVSAALDLGQWCIHKPIQYRVRATDEDEHVCQAGDVPNYIKQTELRVSYADLDTMKRVGSFVLTTRPEGFAREWTKSEKLPDSLAGKKVLLIYEGVVDDVKCLAPNHAASDDPKRTLGPGRTELCFMAKVQPIKVNLAIYNGQETRTEVPEEYEENPGAFTVANINDSDADGEPDVTDNHVLFEEDLMQLRIDKPVPDFGGSVRLTWSASLEIWKGNRNKSGGRLTDHDLPTSELPKIVWVEVKDKSAKLGDQQVQVEYMNCIDKAAITGVWAEKTLMANKNTDSIDDWKRNRGAGDPFWTTFSDLLGGVLGINFAAPDDAFHYSIAFEFAVYPSGVGDVKYENTPVVVFDITRQIQATDWAIDDGRVRIIPDRLRFPPRDIANDDNKQDDEDVTPNQDHIYVVDGPGLPHDLTSKYKEVVSRNNFREFVRVRFDGRRLAGNNDDGSRCSPKIPWHCFYWVEKVVDVYQMKAGHDNEVDERYKEPGPDPIP